VGGAMGSYKSDYVLKDVAKPMHCRQVLAISSGTLEGKQRVASGGKLSCMAGAEASQIAS